MIEGIRGGQRHGGSGTLASAAGAGGGARVIAYCHASKFGNGALAAGEFRKIMAARGITVSVQHIRDANPKDPDRTGSRVPFTPSQARS
jgi:hypothetical protein